MISVLPASTSRYRSQNNPDYDKNDPSRIDPSLIRNPNIIAELRKADIEPAQQKGYTNADLETYQRRMASDVRPLTNNEEHVASTARATSTTSFNDDVRGWSQIEKPEDSDVKLATDADLEAQAAVDSAEQAALQLFQIYSNGPKTHAEVFGEEEPGEVLNYISGFDDADPPNQDAFDHLFDRE